MDGFRHFSWIEGGESFYAIENEKNLVKVVSNSGIGTPTQWEISDRHTLSEGHPILFTVSAFPTSSRDAHREADMVKERYIKARAKHREGIPYAFHLLGKSRSALIVEDDDFGVTLISDGTSRRLPFNSRVWTGARLNLNGVKGNVIDESGLSLMTTSQEHRFLDVLVSSRALIASGGRSAVGRFSPSAVRLDSGESILGGPHEVISSASAALDGRVVISLKDLVTGEKRWELSTPASRAEMQESMSNVSGSLAEAAEERSFNYKEIGSANWAVPIFEWLNTSSSTFVVIFNGGPYGNGMSSPHLNTSLQRYIAMGVNVIVVGYSSSSGLSANAAGRYADYGLAALKRDAEATNEYLKSISEKIGKLVFHGESFGGIPAAFASSHIQRKNTLILIAPYIKSVNPNEWASTKSRLPSVAAEYQYKYERDIVGVSDENRQSFQRELVDIYRKKNKSAVVAAFFGEYDTVSSVKDVNILELSEADKVLEVKTDHGGAMLSSEVWLAIKKLVQ